MHRSPRTTLAPIRDHADLDHALRSLHDSLAVLGRGVEPDLARHLAEVERIAVYARLRLPGTLPVLCRELQTRLWEVACLELPASVEDLDVFLQLLARIELAASKGAPIVSRPDPAPPSRNAPSRPVAGRLRVVPQAGGFELAIPDTEDAEELDRLLEDLTLLAELTPRASEWRVDFSRLRRIPLALVAHLIDLRRADGSSPRRVRLSGLDRGLRSPALARLLEQHFGDGASSPELAH